MLYLICDFYSLHLFLYSLLLFFLEVIGTFVPETPIFALQFIMKMIEKLQLAGCKARFAWSVGTIIFYLAYIFISISLFGLHLHV